jgi:hypothetical protein
MKTSQSSTVHHPSSSFWTGVNYWPAGTAMFWWWRFDLEAVRSELARVAEAGFGCLRFFLLWEAFQPRPDLIRASALRDLELFADAAAGAGLRLQPTLFTGHMSGANWLPEFATRAASGPPRRFSTLVAGEESHGEPRRRPRLQPRNFYAAEGIVQAQELLAREVARVLARHPAMWSWDLGNEHSNVAVPPTREAGRRWLGRIVEALRSGGSEHPLTLGLHMEDLEQDRRLGPAEAAEVCDYLSMHGYPLYAGWVRHPLDVTLLSFLGLLTQWLGGKPVLFQEFGLPTRRGDAETRRPGHSRLSVASTDHTDPRRVPASPRPRVSSHRALQVFDDAQGTEFYRRALLELRREDFLGAFAWCANDYAEPLWQRPPLDDKQHERFFGLFRADGSAKPALEPWRQLHGADLAPAGQPAARGLDWIDISPSEFWRSPRRALRRLYARFVGL